MRDFDRKTLISLFENKEVCKIDKYIEEKTKITNHKGGHDFLKALNMRDILVVLCQRLYNRGLMPFDIQRLTNDILNIIGNGGIFSVGILNQELGRLGWDKNIVDDYNFELILFYLECEGTYKVEAHINP